METFLIQRTLKYMSAYQWKRDIRGKGNYTNSFFSWKLLYCRLGREKCVTPASSVEEHLINKSESVWRGWLISPAAKAGKPEPGMPSRTAKVVARTRFRARSLLLGRERTSGFKKPRKDDSPQTTTPTRKKGPEEFGWENQNRQVSKLRCEAWKQWSLSNSDPSLYVQPSTHHTTTTHQLTSPSQRPSSTNMNKLRYVNLSATWSHVIFFESC